MPTEYTAAVADGTITELAPFALQLARGMGALVTMRDEPWDAPIPDRFEPSGHNAKRLAEARAERDRLTMLTEAEAQAEADRDRAEWETNRANAEADHHARRARYDAMIAATKAWRGAPEGIRDFGLEQLRSGRDWDCREPFEYWVAQPAREGWRWREDRLTNADANIAYHTKADAEERARVEARNAWLAQLRRSLGLAS